MLIVFGALIPVFLLIVLGFALNRVLLTDPSFWRGLEQLVYYVLFPALLIDTLARANLSAAPIAGVGGALLMAVMAMAALCLVLRPWLAKRLNVPVAMVAMIPLLNIFSVAVLAHYAAPTKLSWPMILLAIARNPLI